MRKRRVEGFEILVMAKEAERIPTAASKCSRTKYKALQTVSRTLMPKHGKVLPISRTDNNYDPVKKTYTGGGFPEFTGENANLIGASELPPAEGFEQHGVKMRDGSVGTLYQNMETGEAHLVQFGSIDNGEMQGTISEIDKDTGHFGDFMAFKAVHQSVPRTESFSGFVYLAAIAVLVK